MTDEELAATKARAEAATGGDWSADFTDHDFNLLPNNGCWIRGGEQDDVVVAHVIAADYKADILFMTHARADIPALVADNEAKGAELERWRAVGRAVARGFTLIYSDMDDSYFCALCHKRLPTPPNVDLFGEWTRVGWRERHIQHDADCPVTEARALLGMSSEGERLMAERKQGLDDITRLNQEMGLYDAPQGTGEGEAQS